jgi:hypothetical protein
VLGREVRVVQRDERVVLTSSAALGGERDSARTRLGVRRTACAIPTFLMTIWVDQVYAGAGSLLVSPNGGCAVLRQGSVIGWRYPHS